MSCYFSQGSLFGILCVLLAISCMSNGCFEEERTALLNIRRSLLGTTAGMPPSWLQSDCCSWERVICNNSTKRISHLNLSRLSFLSDEFSPEECQTNLNSTAISAFPELLFLDFSMNHVTFQIWEGVVGLTKLQHLNLSSNNCLNGTIPASLGKLVSLEVLHLEFTGMVGTLPTSAFVNLRNLRELYLSSNQFNGTLPASLGKLVSLEVLHLECTGMVGTLPTSAFVNLRNLRELYLSSNQFNGTLPASLGKLVSLEVLHLEFTGMVGTLPTSAFENLRNLRELYLNSNQFNGTLPASLGKLVSLEVLHLEFNGMVGTLPTSAFENLRNLRELYLSSNQFNGTLPASLFTHPHIEHLDLSGNLFEGSVPISLSSNISSSLKVLNFSMNRLSGNFSLFWLRNLTNLEKIDLSRNNNLAVVVNFPGWAPSFQLKELMLSGCDLDRSIIAEPRFLRTQRQLEVLDLSNNNLPGSMPNWLFTKEATLIYLNLGNNSLAGSLFDSVWYAQTNIQAVSVSANRISGHLPANISSIFPNMVFLDFSRNNISGEIPSSLCNISNMEYLDLSNNSLSGELPTCMFTDYPMLKTLKVSKNKLSGPILGGKNHLFIKWELYLDGNNFEGELPRYLTANFVFVGTLDFHDNKLSGKLDFSLWRLNNLWTLSLGSNGFTGEIHPSICSLGIVLLDLSNNNLSGAIPNCSSTTMNLEFLDVSGNSLSGEILPYSFFNSTTVTALDLSHNEFTGNIEWIQYLGRIRYLSLGSNKFEGQISPNICQLKSLRVIDLSNNSLSGSLPPCIGNLSFEENSYGLSYWSLGCGRGFQYPGFNYTSCYKQRGFRFATKRNLYTYGIGFINWLSGMDLSANKLSGEIPWELGNLSHIQALNLSYNIFTGPIPATFANMIEIESLDLSRNKLSGPIPWQLTRLTSLAVFSVAYNNLSGCIPNSGQFGSFDMDSYKGNNNLYKASQGSGCPSSPGSGPSPLEDSDKEANDPVLHAISTASFVLTFWATVAFMFCHSFGQRVILKL